MKVIGHITNDKYICEIKHSELEKFLNLYYNKKDELKLGEEVDLGKGYDWCRDTEQALNETKKFFNSNIKTINAITRAFTITQINYKKGE